MTSTLVVLLLVQSLSPATYAAKITPAKDDAAGINTSQTATTQPTTNAVISALEKLVNDNTKQLDGLGVDISETSNWINSYKSWLQNGQESQANTAAQDVLNYFQSLLDGKATYDDADMSKAFSGPWVIQLDSRFIDAKTLAKSDIYQQFKDTDPDYKDKGRLDVYVSARNYHNTSQVDRKSVV